ncbi:hypothetical protein [Pseudoduganella sp. R-43]|uniref:hypothetical protein n=1 Tax=unclassified Pseudoduganella TaxID=2637179 RepID=UPI003CEDAAAC
MKKTFALVAATGAVFAALAAGIYSYSTAGQPASDTKAVQPPVTANAKPASTPAEPVTVIGTYFNMEYSDTDEPHANSGYSLDLYKQGNVVFGAIGIADGSLEPSQASIYDVIYNEEQKTISFKAKYSDGSEFVGDKEREARVQLTFSGKIDKDQIKGTVTKLDAYTHEPREEPELAVIPKSDGEPDVPTSFDEWDKSHSHPIPKW